MDRLWKFKEDGVVDEWIKAKSTTEHTKKGSDHE